MMLIVHDALEQTFVSVFNELSGSGVTIAIQAEPNTSSDQCSMRCLSAVEANTHQAGEA